RISFDSYVITGASTTSMVLHPVSSTVVSTDTALFPHIDMFTDFSTMIGGYPSMHKFVLSYGQKGGSGVMDVFERNGDIMNPVSLSTPYAITFGAFCPYGGDVSAVYDPTTGKQYAYFAIVDANNLEERQIVLNVLPAIAPPIALG